MADQEARMKLRRDLDQLLGLDRIAEPKPDIETVVSEMKDLESRITDLQSQVNTRKAELHAQIMSDRDRRLEQDKSNGHDNGDLRSNQAAHQILRLQFGNGDEQLKELMRELKPLQQRYSELENLKEQYLYENRELVDELRREQTKDRLRKLGLV